MLSIEERIDLQNKEFDAIDQLARCWKRLTVVAVVDDDYPRVRYYYETAVRSVIEAFKANGRIQSWPLPEPPEEK